jgi:hypothetical protein
LLSKIIVFCVDVDVKKGAGEVYYCMQMRADPILALLGVPALAIASPAVDPPCNGTNKQKALVV